MIARIITLSGNKASLESAQRCINSSAGAGNEFDIKIFEAVTAEQVPRIMNKNMFQWSYPIEGSRDDFATGMRLNSYPTAVIERRIACFLSHYFCWKEAVDTNEPVLILEHDAIFNYKFDPQEFIDSKWEAVGINDPRGATRRANNYHDIVQTFTKNMQQVPSIDEFNIPQGMAGNSAYVIKPSLANKAIKKFKEIGMWPNDALLCRQLFPAIAQTKQYYTKVQGIESTTSL